jgi:hypothetical protein
MCSKDDVNSVHNWMGNFSDIKCIGKYAARLGQSLSSSVETFQTNRFDFYIIISPNIFYYINAFYKNRLVLYKYPI